MYCHILLWNKVRSYDSFLQFAEVYLLLSKGKSYWNTEYNARNFLSWHDSSDVQNYFADEQWDECSSVSLIKSSEIICGFNSY